MFHICIDFASSYCLQLPVMCAFTALMMYLFLFVDEARNFRSFGHIVSRYLQIARTQFVRSHNDDVSSNVIIKFNWIYLLHLIKGYNVECDASGHAEYATFDLILFNSFFSVPTCAWTI